MVFPFPVYLLPCGCSPSALPKPCCCAAVTACPTPPIPVRSACCEAQVQCRAEDANADLLACAALKAEQGWVGDAQGDRNLGAMLAIGADLLANACDPAVATCLADALRKHIPRQPCN